MGVFPHQNAPYKTKEYKAKETTLPPTVLSKHETCASCKTEDDPQNMIFRQECYKPIYQGCARKRNGCQICFPCRRAKTLEAAKYTDNSDSPTYQPTPSEEESHDTDDDFKVDRLLKPHHRPTALTPPNPPIYCPITGQSTMIQRRKLVGAR
jgi:hypothetical protein